MQIMSTSTIIVIFLGLLFFLSFSINCENKHKILWKRFINFQNKNRIADLTFTLIIVICITLIIIFLLKVMCKTWLTWLLKDFSDKEEFRYFLVSILLCHPISYISNIVRKYIYSSFGMGSLTKKDFYLFNENTVNNVNIIRVFVIFIVSILMFTNYNLFDTIWLLLLTGLVLLGSGGNMYIMSGDSELDLDKIDPYTYTVEYCRKEVPQNVPLTNEWKDRIKSYVTSFFVVDISKWQFDSHYPDVLRCIRENELNMHQMSESQKALCERRLEWKSKWFWKDFIATIDKHDLSIIRPKIYTAEHSSSLIYTDKHCNVAIIINVKGELSDITKHMEKLKHEIFRDHGSYSRFSREKRLWSERRVIYLNVARFRDKLKD